jgi:hypothetical protein
MLALGSMLVAVGSVARRFAVSTSR